MVGAEPGVFWGGLACFVLYLIDSEVIMDPSVPNLHVTISFFSALYLLSSPSDVLCPETGLLDSGSAGCRFVID